MEPHPYGTINGLSSQEVFILVYCLAHKFLIAYILNYGPWRSSTNGLLPRFTDAEALTVCIVKHLLAPKASERKWLHKVRRDWDYLFPDLPSRSRMVRRRVALGPLIDFFRIWLLDALCVAHEPDRLLDSAPLELAKYIRARKNLNRRFRPRQMRDPDTGKKVYVEVGWADIGYCASMKTYYFGMKLHVLCSLEGIPVVWCLTPASWDDRKVVEQLLEADPMTRAGGQLYVWTDSGYISEELASRIWERWGHDIQAMPKRSRKDSWPKQVYKFVGKARKAVESLFSDGARFLGIQNMRPASLRGLMSDMAAKMTAAAIESLADRLHHLIDAPS